jgi:hypothetical protein
MIWLPAMAMELFIFAVSQPQAQQHKPAQLLASKNTLALTAEAHAAGTVF